MTEYIKILSSNSSPYYSAAELIDNETECNIDKIRFKCPLFFIYNNSYDVSILISSLNHLKEYLSSSYKIKSKTPQKKLLELCDVMYSIREDKKNNNKIKFPRDRIESYSLLYSVLGIEEDHDTDEIIFELDKVINSIKGANRVDVICYPESLLNKKKWKVHYQVDFNARIAAYFSSTKEEKDQKNINECNGNNIYNSIKRGSIGLVGGSLVGAVLGLSMSGSAYLSGLLLHGIFPSVGETLSSFSSHYLSFGYIGSVIGGGCGLFLGLENDYNINEKSSSERRRQREKLIHKKTYWEQKRN